MSQTQEQAVDFMGEAICGNCFWWDKKACLHIPAGSDNYDHPSEGEHPCEDFEPAHGKSLGSDISAKDEEGE